MLRQFEAMKSDKSAPSTPLAEIDYVHGLQRLQLLVEQYSPALKEDFLTLEMRLLDNLNDEAKYGSTETSRADRARIVNALNDLVKRAGLESSFNDLCRR